MSGGSLYLIEILHQTTTLFVEWLVRNQLYLIEILHQTTTSPGVEKDVAGCILLKFYIKPQLCAMVVLNAPCCILLKFYIKPQLPVPKAMRK